MRDELARRVLELARPAIEGDRPLLDVGCGSGWWLARLQSAGVEGHRLAGIDILPGRVAAARQAVPLADVLQADARRLPWSDETFGMVTMFTFLSSLAEMRDARSALLEARRVTAPSGLIVVWEPRWPTPWNRDRPHLGRRAYEGLPGVALHYESITLIPGAARRLGRATDRIYPALARVPLLRSHRLVVATARLTGAPH